jgi:hypothetical protein
MMKGVGSNTFVKYKNNNHFKNVPERLYKKGGGRFENSTLIITCWWGYPALLGIFRIPKTLSLTNLTQTLTLA